MRQLDAMYYLHDFIRSRINNVDRVAGAVRDIDSRQTFRRRLGDSRANSAHPFRDHEPVGIVLRRKLPATRMKRISSGLGRKRMDQEPAGSRIAGNDHLQSALIVSLRLLIAPLRAPR